MALVISVYRKTTGTEKNILQQEYVRKQTQMIYDGYGNMLVMKIHLTSARIVTCVQDFEEKVLGHGEIVI